MESPKASIETTGIYFPQPKEDGLSFKDMSHTPEVDQLAELFNKMMSEPMNPANALQFQLYTYEKSLPWQFSSAISRNCTSGLQQLMNGQV